MTLKGKPLHSKRDKRHLFSKHLQIQNLKKKTRGTWHIISPRLKKWGEDVSRVTHHVVPMDPEYRFTCCVDMKSHEVSQFSFVPTSVLCTKPAHKKSRCLLEQTESANDEITSVLNDHQNPMFFRKHITQEYKSLFRKHALVISNNRCKNDLFRNTATRSNLKHCKIISLKWV